MGIYNFRNQKSVFKKKEKRNRRRNFKIIKKQKKSTSNVKLKKKIPTCNKCNVYIIKHAFY